MQKLVKPIVNLNGTSRESLVQQFADMATAVRTARETLAKNSPHPRDFQTAKTPHVEYDKARVAFADRYEALHAMEDEFMSMALELQQEGK